MGEPPVNDDGIFDQNFARSYDRNHGATDPKLIRKTVDVLERHAAGGEALEFAVGTGRIALPLAARGVPVKGIELSKAMVAELRRKETGTAMDVTIGDMTTTRMPGAFSLVYLVFNTIDNLTSQDAQVACFENAATHLQPNGRFLVETLVPPIQNIPFGETNHAFECSPTHWGIDTYDIATQLYTSNHVWFENGSHSQLSIPFRYTSPAELDLMARIAGLELETRWSNWDGAPFTNTSKRHISVWKMPALHG